LFDRNKFKKQPFCSTSFRCENRLKINWIDVQEAICGTRPGNVALHTSLLQDNTVSWNFMGLWRHLKPTCGSWRNKI